MATCLVIGGGGFVGTNLCRALVGGGHAVRGFGRAPVFPEALAAIPWTTAELADTGALARALRGVDVVYHLIGASTPASSIEDKIGDLRDNVEGTLRLLDLVLAAGARRVVFMSSGGTVYGVPADLPIPEDAPTEPISAYGVSKLMVEKYLGLYRHLHGLDFVVLRVSNPYGPYQTGRKRQGVVASLIASALTGRPFEMWGDGSVIRDYVHIDDVVGALVRAADHAGAHRLFNIGSGVGTSLRELIGRVEQLTGRSIELQVLPGRPLDVPANVLDIARAAGDLGWRPRIPLDRGLAAMHAWLATRLAGP